MSCRPTKRFQGFAGPVVQFSKSIIIKNIRAKKNPKFSLNLPNKKQADSSQILEFPSFGFEIVSLSCIPQKRWFTGMCQCRNVEGLWLVNVRWRNQETLPSEIKQTFRIHRPWASSLTFSITQPKNLESTYFAAANLAAAHLYWSICWALLENFHSCCPPLIFVCFQLLQF